MSAKEHDFTDMASIEAADKSPMDHAREILAAAVAGDVGAPFADSALDVLRSLKEANLADWMRVRAGLKGAKVSITELDRAMRTSGEESGPDGVADALIELARSRAEFIHDPDGEPYAVIHDGNVRQTLHIGSKAFGEWLSFAHYRDTDRAPSENAVKTALSTLAGQAKFDGAEKAVFLRVATTEPGTYWLDLADDAWRSVRIDRHGWAIVQGGDAPLFTRSASMRPLPEPAPGGDLSALWELVNIPEVDRVTVAAFLVECLRPDTAYPVLLMFGGQGTGKSCTHSMLRNLFDPNQVNLRAAPKTVEDMWVAARSSHTVSYENLSHLTPAQQDALCTVATGGGVATRTLFTTCDETVIQVKRPVMLNGIAAVITAQDLIDRAILVELPTVTHRRTGGAIEEAFKAEHPRIVGALLDLFVSALAVLPSVDIPAERLPRMADFTLLGEAVARVLGKQPGEFLAAYTAMRVESVHRTIEASPVGAALVAMLEARPHGFDGTVKDLMHTLGDYRPTGEAWPMSAKGMGDALRRLATSMRLIGIDIKDRGRSKQGYCVRIARLPAETVKAIPVATPATEEF
ncbi:hypothetical protein [Sphaerotilus sp.]|uniref:hypothetical protein n=1 Tax=Sphaerotilus sp. TaxID=2093942 RepID=UPI00286DE245|nr:hypothetical protein [Sphaerotilus sp.]